MKKPQIKSYLIGAISIINFGKFEIDVVIEIRPTITLAKLNILLHYN